MIERLPWDSEHFGIPIGRVIGSELTAEDVDAADRCGVHCLYLLVDAGDATTVHAAEDLGFRFVDVRLTLQRAVEPTDHDAVPANGMRSAVAEDLAFLEPIAATAHADSRFFFDTRFHPAAAAQLYVRWLRASVLDGFADVALVTERGGRPSGYITGRANQDGASLSIGLLGVAARERGRGLGPALLEALVQAAAAGGARRVDVVTQGRNVRAQRLYQAAGFRTTSTEVWLHRWTPVRDSSSSNGCPRGQAIGATSLR